MEKRKKAETIEFEFRKLDVAAARREKGDLIGALNVLRNIEDDPVNIEVYARIAALYFDMELYELSLEYWFKYLASSDAVKVKAKAYGAIAACMCMIGDIKAMGYYVELASSLGVKGDPEYDKVIMDYYDYYCDCLGPAYYVSYPVEKIPGKKLMFEADSLLDDHKIEDAIEKLSAISKTDEYYCEARGKMAKCYYMLDRKDEARSLVEDLIADFPDDAFSCMAYGFMLMDHDETFGSDKGGARYYLKKASQGTLFDEEDYFKIAFALCSLGSDEDAFLPLEKAFDINEYYLNAILLYGELLYNRGDYVGAERYFRKFYHLTRNVVGTYFLHLAENKIGGKINYSFNPPKEITDSIAEDLISITDGGKGALKNYPDESVESLIDWSFMFNRELCNDFITAIVGFGSTKARNYLIGKLLTNDMPGDAKLKLIEELAVRDYNKKLSFTVETSFVQFQVLPADFEEPKGELFKKAYAFALARTCAFEKDLTKLRDAAYNLYYECRDRGVLKKLNDKCALGCVIAIKSGFKIKDRKIYELFFDTTKKEVKSILDLLKKEE